MSSVILVATLPTTRQSGAALALSEIASLVFTRDTGGGPQPLATVPGPFASPTVSYTDTSPAVGSDAYAFAAVDTAGLQGAFSAPVSVTVAAPADPPAAGTLTATVEP